MGEPGDSWPVTLRGVTESVVTTSVPEGGWNVAALGLRAGEPVTARTWGRTRTRRAFEREGEGYVQFTTDPVLFVEAALDIRVEPEPILEAAAAWVRVEAKRLDAGESGGTEWVEWEFDPREATVRHEEVPTTNRGYNAVVEATVAASRLDVDAYETEEMLDRLAFFETVARRCGGDRERAAFDRVYDLVDHPSLEPEQGR